MTAGPSCIKEEIAKRFSLGIKKEYHNIQTQWRVQKLTLSSNSDNLEKKMQILFKFVNKIFHLKTAPAIKIAAPEKDTSTNRKEHKMRNKIGTLCLPSDYKEMIRKI